MRLTAAHARLHHSPTTNAFCYSFVHTRYHQPTAAAEAEREAAATHLGGNIPPRPGTRPDNRSPSPTYHLT